MKNMGCGCDLGCDCANQSLGQAEGSTGLNPWWFVAGGAAGVGLWYLLKNAVADGPGQTVAAPMPTIASPSRYVNLQSVALRLDQVKTLYRSGQLTPIQAIAESEGLITAANSFSLQEGERVSEVVAAILAFEAEVEDFIQFKKENPDPAKTVPTRTSPSRPGVSAYA